ncbi:hypothetical protein Pcinc_011917 [Petrolisthes cinctipes]|uniref:Uncharacterized protein n=1 Tax=Petrolisthes cinctipes TaxID=88211 RepID=A0AAE1KU11_PETCI|nr:hypothetical protein Pcinc_011917 [Petrolisthes cinctipes]
MCIAARASHLYVLHTSHVHISQHYSTCIAALRRTSTYPCAPLQPSAHPHNGSTCIAARRCTSKYPRAYPHKDSTCIAARCRTSTYPRAPLQSRTHPQTTLIALLPTLYNAAATKSTHTLKDSLHTYKLSTGQLTSTTFSQ